MARNVFLVGNSVAENSIYQVNVNEGSISATRIILPGTQQCSFLALHPFLPVVYAVHSTQQGSVSAFNVTTSGDSVSLRPLDSASATSTLGDDPCHVDVDPSGQFLAVANYNSGDAVLYVIESSGAIGRPHHIRHDTKVAPTGPNKERQEAPHCHFVMFRRHADSLLLFVVDLGLDRVQIYRVDVTQRRAEPYGHLELPPGSGPRHLAFHNRYVFVGNELSNTVSVCVKNHQQI